MLRLRAATTRVTWTSLNPRASLNAYQVCKGVHSTANMIAGGAANGDAVTQCAAQPSYQHFRLSSAAAEMDWVQDLELDGARQLGDTNTGPSGSAGATSTSGPPRVLVLYGSLRDRSYSRLLAYEFSRILVHLGADVRVYDPQGLPMKDGSSDKHPKVVELRDLSIWSEGQVWVCPEQHGTITAVFKNQIDWIPLELGSVRPTQGRTVAIAQVNGGSQSFNVVNVLRQLGRWMRMITIPNQSSVPKAWTEFDEAGRMKPSSYRDRVVDVAEELFKFTLLLRGHAGFLVDRYSEREERRVKGRLLSQAEKEASKNAQAVAATPATMVVVEAATTAPVT